jgi:hypothetical protein
MALSSAQDCECQSFQSVSLHLNAASALHLTYSLLALFGTLHPLIKDPLASHTLYNVNYTDGDSIDVVCKNLQSCCGFLNRLKILTNITSSQFAKSLSLYPKTPLIGADTETGTTYVFTFCRTPGSTGVNVEYKIAKGGTSQTNIAAGARATSANNAMSGPRVEYNDAATGANQTNSAAGVGASASFNQACDPNTVQTNKASMCQIL